MRPLILSLPTPDLKERQNHTIREHVAPLLPAKDRVRPCVVQSAALLCRKTWLKKGARAAGASESLSCCLQTGRGSPQRAVWFEEMAGSWRSLTRSRLRSAEVHAAHSHRRQHSLPQRENTRGQSRERADPTTANKINLQIWPPGYWGQGGRLVISCARRKRHSYSQHG